MTDLAITSGPASRTGEPTRLAHAVQAGASVFLGFFVCWFLAEAVFGTGPWLARHAETVLVLNQLLFCWIAAPWLAADEPRPFRGLAAGLTLALVPMPVHSMLLLMGGTTAIALLVAHLAFAAAITLPFWLARAALRLPWSEARITLVTLLQFLPPLALWFWRSAWLDVLMHP